MLVTAAVFHSTMLPYVVVAVLGLVTHAFTAVTMLAFVMAVIEVTWAGSSRSSKPTSPYDRRRLVPRSGYTAVGGSL